MNQTTIVESMERHMDMLKATVGWAFIVSIALAWMALSDEEEW